MLRVREPNMIAASVQSAESNQESDDTERLLNLAISRLCLHSVAAP
jgi:hypothetical protein